MDACSYNLAGIFQFSINLHLSATVKEKLTLLLLENDSCFRSLGDIPIECQDDYSNGFILESIEDNLTQFEISNLMMSISCCIINSRDHRLTSKVS